MGEALRMFLSEATGGPRRTSTERLTAPIHQAAVEAVGMGAGAAVIAGAHLTSRVAGHVGRTLYRHLPEPLLNYARQRFSQGVNLLDEATFRSRDVLLTGMQRLRDAIQKVQKTPPKSPAVESLYPVAERAANAFDAVRKTVGRSYGQQALDAAEQPVRVSLVKARNVIFQEAREKGLIDLQGNPIALFSRGATRDEQVLLGVLKDFQDISSRPIEGLLGATAQGTFANYTHARRLLERLDEAIGSVTTRNAKRIIISVKEAVDQGLKSSDQALGRVSQEYAQVIDLRDLLEDAFRNPDKAVGLLVRATRSGAQDLRQKLQLLDQLAPENLKFLPDLDAYVKQLEQVELAKQAPKSLSQLLRSVKTDEQLEAIMKGIFQLPEVTLMQLESLERLTGIPFLEFIKDYAASQAFRGSTPRSLLSLTPEMEGLGLRYGAPILRQMGQGARAVQPYLPPGASGLLRLMGSEQAQ